MLVQLQKTALAAAELHSKVKSTLVYTDEGVPVLAAVDMEGKIVVITCDDPKFPQLLESFGFDKRMIPEVQRVKL